MSDDAVAFFAGEGVTNKEFLYREADAETPLD